jgi:outer membrane lipoprotein carrier protein
MRLLPPPTAAVAAWIALASCLAAPQRPAAGVKPPASRVSDLPHGLPGVAAAEQSALELAQALQRKYEAIRGFAADFVHTYRGGVLNKRLTERGHLLVKKPGKMRWEYTAPEKKLFVSDGVKIYSYVPEDKQVIVSDVPSGDALTTPVLFLAGRGNLARDFDPSFTDLPPGAAPGSRALKLVPKAAQPDYDWLVVVVDAATLGLRGLMYSDPQGGTSTFSFTNLKENAELTDRAFDFKVPRGVDVVTDPSVR